MYVFLVMCAYTVGVLIGISACEQAPEIPAIPEDYRTWRQTTDIVFDYPVPGHEDHFRKIYINPLGENFTIVEKNNRSYCEFPEGTIIVKEIYANLNVPAPQTLPVLLAVMIKNSAHPEARSGWLWLSQNYDTKETNIIDYEFCVDCHANANERHPYGDKNPDEEFRDFVFFPPQHAPSQEKSPSAPYPSGY
jgi:hypothetical protein